MTYEINPSMSPANVEAEHVDLLQGATLPSGGRLGLAPTTWLHQNYSKAALLQRASA